MLLFHAFGGRPKSKKAVPGDGVRDFRRLAYFGVRICIICKGHCKVSISDSVLARLFVSYFRPPSPLFQVLQDDSSPCTATEIELIPILVRVWKSYSQHCQYVANNNPVSISRSLSYETWSLFFSIKYLISCILGVSA